MILEAYQNRKYGGVETICERFDLSRSAVHRIVKRQLQRIGPEDQAKSETELSSAKMLPGNEPTGAVSASSSKCGDRDEEDDESQDRAFQPEHEALKQDHDELLDEHNALIEVIDGWMRYLREQATIYRAPDSANKCWSETECVAAARFLTDLAWDMEKWLP